MSLMAWRNSGYEPIIRYSLYVLTYNQRLTSRVLIQLYTLCARSRVCNQWAANCEAVRRKRRDPRDRYLLQDIILEYALRLLPELNP